LIHLTDIPKPFPKGAKNVVDVPTYYWMLENKATEEIEKLCNIVLSNDIVFLDFDTNSDIENLNKPLSHASLIKKFIELKHPQIIDKRFTYPKSKKKSNTKVISNIIDTIQLEINF
jgi:hypothetical protein